MRSMDRTLLAQLGFQDKDRTSQHDEACATIAAHPQCLVDAAFGANPLRRSYNAVLEYVINKGGGQYQTTIGFLDVLVGWQTPTVLNDWKVGCADDLVTMFRAQYRESNPHPSWKLAGAAQLNKEYDRVLDATCSDLKSSVHDNLSGPSPAEWNSHSLAVEVKTKIDGVGDLLRQMRLYEEYLKFQTYVDTWVIVSLEPSDVRYTDLIKQQGYRLLCI